MEEKEVLDDRSPQAHSRRSRAHVPVLNRGREVAVIGKERWEDIQRLRADGPSLSAIARHLDLDRKTVRTCLKPAERARY